MGRHLALTGVLGALLLVGSPLAWTLAEPARSVGDLEAISGTAADGAPGATRALDELGTVVPRDDAAEPAAQVAPPTRLRMDALGVDAPLVAVGLEPSGAMTIPADVREVGWYEPGVVPGMGGTAVLAGHVDNRSQGRGALFELRRSAPGDLLEVAHADGTTTVWRVTARTVYAKGELPIADLFTRFGPTRLVVITCGGRFDAATRQYDENVVVYTEPVTGDPEPADG